MRKELEVTEKIDKYLNKELSEQEHIAFGKEIEQSPELKKDVENQKLLQEGVKSLTIRQQATKAFRIYRITKILKLVGITTGVVTAGFFLWYLISNKNTKENININDTITEIVDTTKNNSDTIISEISENINDTIILNPTGNITNIVIPDTVQNENDIVVPIEIILEAEDCDAFFDKSPGNKGNKYRTDDLDIDTCQTGGYQIGWIEKGEWISFDFDIEKTALYNIKLIVASNNTDNYKQLKILLNEKELNIIDIPFTGGWQNMQTIDIGEFEISAQNNIKLEIFFITSGFNFDKIIITETTTGN